MDKWKSAQKQFLLKIVKWDSEQPMNVQLYYTSWQPGIRAVQTWHHEANIQIKVYAAVCSCCTEMTFSALLWFKSMKNLIKKNLKNHF